MFPFFCDVSTGKGKISFLYPNKSSVPKSVNDLEFDGLALTSDLHEVVRTLSFEQAFHELCCFIKYLIFKLIIRINNTTFLFMSCWDLLVSMLC
jgi:hypothetical protein